MTHGSLLPEPSAPKECAGCGKLHALVAFYYSPAKRAYSSRCRPCHIAQGQAAYAAQREVRAAQRRERRAADPERYRAAERARRATPEGRARRRREGRERYQANRERLLGASKAYHAAHKTELAARTREWQQRNKDRVNAKTRRWYEQNRHKVIDLQARRRAQKLGGAAEALTTTEWRRIREAFGGCCAYCGAAPRTLEVEHVVPLTRGGTHTADNIVPACRSCNASKNDRLLLEWAIGTNGAFAQFGRAHAPSARVRRASGA